ncbi:hypothetical protein CW740_05115 [Kangiella profundi]|uniref:Uncharacterized protein n=1 Tax=Kangiella profundi TaxID=1561924 RepID=A0A2K9A483_9GAMM|nr:TetR/AcrR family transcriptional regulator [Kangiella profundi]AUD78665.1 hypothetical protein CW740_05115 [Kangiella profundi]GGF09924.1 hypothetical protein GCM10011356_24170 [Kangiella profundi]
MTSLREKKKQHSYQTIYQTALSLFEEYGFDKVSVAQIVKQSAIAKGTFFNYFPNKPDILAQWFDDIMSKAIEQPIPNDAPLEQRVLLLAKHILQAAQQQPNLWQAKNAYAGQSDSIQKVESRIDERIHSRVEHFIEQSALRMDTNKNSDLAELIVTLMTGTIVEANRRGHSDDAMALIEHKLSILLSLAKG